MMEGSEAADALRRTTVDDLPSGDVGSHPNDLFFAAVQTTRMPMIVTDPRKRDNPIVFVNRAFLDLTGYEEDELLGTNCRFLQGPETDPCVIGAMREAITAQADFGAEILNYRKDGSTFWNALSLSPVFNRAGELVYYFGSQLDVSRRRDAEEALRQAQKMEALGQLTGGIAHDFNNLLQVMSGYLELIEAAADSGRVAPEQLKRNVGRAREAAQQAATLTQQLLAFSRKQKLEGRVVNLNSLIGSLADIARRTLGDDVVLETRFATDLLNCRLDATQAEVALLNILINARDAMADTDARKVLIETRNVAVPKDGGGSHDNLQPGDYACVVVTDSGVGMPADILVRVLDPFFTTKEEGKGTGLGLSMVYGFAKQSGGAVRITSDEGKGTTVRMFFPAGEEVPYVAPRERLRSSDRGGDETILIVEDRPEVAELAQMFLEDQGYTTHMAYNAREAMALLDGGLVIDLLYTDLIMPGGMNGVMLAREARRRNPRLKVLLTTGYSDASIERTDSSGTDFDVLPKPYNRKELTRKVRIVLDGPGGSA